MRFPKLWIVLTMVGLIFESSHALAETRIALVVGNSTYQRHPDFICDPTGQRRFGWQRWPQPFHKCVGANNSEAGPWHF